MNINQLEHILFLIVGAQENDKIEGIQQNVSEGKWAGENRGIRFRHYEGLYDYLHEQGLWSYEVWEHITLMGLKCHRTGYAIGKLQDFQQTLEKISDALDYVDV